ncbi:fungal fruit body lectin, partial [Lactarius akahatsu]
LQSHKRWGDIVTNLKNDQTACTINPEYYSNEHANRQRQREKQLTAYEVALVADLQGRRYSLEYYVTEGNVLEVRIVIF